MAKCIFCEEEVIPGKLYHNSENCINQRNKVKDSLLKEDLITVGLATCGISAGGKELTEVLKRSELNIPIEEVGCNGMCYNEPIVSVRQNGIFSIYSKINKDNAAKLVKAIKDGKILDNFFMGHNLNEITYFKHQERMIMKRCGLITPLNLKHYIITEGFIGLINALKKKPEDVVKDVKESGLRGRGGAGFSTGIKWSLYAPKTGIKYLIVNGDEGDPGAFMNRTVMESDPFQLLEGLIIAAYATNTKTGIIYTRAEYPLAVETLNKAIQILKENGLLGQNILGIDGFDFEIEMKIGAGAFVCGEETALIRSVEGKRGHPRPRPPYPAESGVYGYPSNINNIETYCHVTHIMINGPELYKKVGSQNNSGTKCVCLTGKIKYSGVVEVPLGIPIKKLIYDIGGGIKEDKKFKAVQSGGPSGGCIIESELDTPLDFDHMPKLGTIMGSGGLVIMDETDCMVNVSKFFLNFTTEESCGKCVPCREGTKRMLEILDSISKGVAKIEDIDKLRHLASVIKDTSLCGLGQTAPNPVLSTIEKFRDEYLMHIKEKKCATGICEALISYIITEKCKGCGNCQRHCPVNTISGELKQKYKIIQEKCIKCGKCFSVCAFKAIIKK